MKHFFTTRYLLFLSVLSLLIVSCSDKEDAPQLDDQHQMITFKIDSILGQIDETNHTVTITVPGTIDLTSVKPVVAVSSKASVTPASGATVDLTMPVTYTVIAQDKSEQKYVVTAKKAVNLDNRILNFEIRSGSYTYKGVVNDTNFTVRIGAPFTQTGAVDPTKVATSVIIPAGATITPAVDAVVDFTSPVKYKVTAPNGEIQEYTVSVLNTETSLKSFNIPLSGFGENDLRPTIILHTGNEIGLWPDEIEGLRPPFGLFHALESEDVSNLKLKDVVLSKGATISPGLDTAQDFNNDVVYTVTSQYGNTEKYTIRAFKKKIIMKFEFAPTTYMINEKGGNLEEYLSDQSIKEAWFVKDNVEYKLTVDPATRYPWGYVTTRFYANTAALSRGYYTLKLKLTDDTVIPNAHRIYMY